MDDLFDEMQQAADHAGDLIAVVISQASALGVDAPQLLTDAAWELWAAARSTKTKGLPWPRTFVPTAGASDMDRRRFLAGVVATAGAVISETPHTPPTTTTLLQLRAGTDQLRIVHADGAARGAIGAMLRHTQALGLAAKHAADDRLQRELLVAHGDALTLLTRFLGTAGLVAQARRATAAAVTAAEEAGHSELAAYALGQLALLQAHHLHDLQGALTTVDVGLARAGGATWRTRAWLAAQRAEVLSMMGERAGTLAALEEAHVLMSASVPHSDLPWLGPNGGFESIWDVSGYAGACALRIGDATMALAALQVALDQRGHDAGRAGAVLVDLGGAYALMREPEAACTVLVEALARARAWRSVALVNRLGTVRPRLDPWQGERFVTELDEQIAATAAAL